MKTWNAHAWYCIGILLALLIGTVSVQWNTVERLPEIISFAVGLSSLLLAVFAIIQSMTAGNDASATLAAVREAAVDLKTTAGGTLNTLGDLKSLSSSMLSASEASRVAITELNEKIGLKGESGTSASKNNPEGSLSNVGITAGGGPALYAAILSYQKQITFDFDDIFPEDKDTDYERGYLDGLTLTGLITAKKQGNDRLVTAINHDVEALKTRIRERKFKNPNSAAFYTERVEQVEKHFGSADRGSKAPAARD